MLTGTKRIALTLITICLLAFGIKAQVDTAFWFVAPEVTSAHGDSPILLRISTLSNPANVTISQPANPGFSPITQTIPANTTNSVDLTPFIGTIENKPANSVLNYGILIQSSKPITAYYEVNRVNNPDIFPLKGKNALGTDFYTPFQNYWNNANFNPASSSAFDIVATEDSTVVTIIPKKDIIGHIANVPFTILLNKGQTYSAVATSLLAGGHLGGSRVTSNKPIAITIKDDSMGHEGCLDLMGEQLVPVPVIGMEYIIMKGGLTNNEHIFVLAVDDSTDVFVGGSATPTATINEGETFAYQITANTTYINTSKPVYVLHLTGFGCELGGALLPSIECTGSGNVVFTRSTNESFRLNIMVKTGAEGDFTLNGSSTLVPASAFSPVSGSNWSAAQIIFNTTDVPVGIRSIISNNSDLFHLGVINGGNSSGCRYGYFSGFSGLYLGSTTSLCYGDTITLDAGPGFNSYYWSNGDTTQTTRISTPGIYWATVTKGNCTNTDTLSVYLYPTKTPDLGNDNVLCEGETITLNADTGFTSYLWSNGATTPSIVTGGGTYFVRTTNSYGCIAYDTIQIWQNNPTALFLSSPSIYAERNTTITFTDSSVNGVGTITQWLWDFGNGQTATTQNPSYTYPDTGLYKVTLHVTDANGCSDTISFDIHIKELLIPNVFTPNGDNQNDFFAIKDLFIYPEAKLTIFNRWGKKIYTSNNYKNDWDGGDAPAGVYYYILRVNEKREEKGFVTILK